MLLFQSAPAEPGIAAQATLWVIGALCSFIGALLLILLQRVLKQGDDTNGKVTKQGESLSRVELSVSQLDSRVTSLHDWRNKVQEREMEKALEDLDIERRKNVRREDDRGLA